VAALHAAAFRGPIRKNMQPMPVFPSYFEKFASIHVGCFFSQEGFQAPLQIGTGPRTQTIAARSHPIKPENIPHESILTTVSPVRPAQHGYPSGAEMCSCTSSQSFPRFSQIPV
jgi:hypothetical protein